MTAATPPKSRLGFAVLVLGQPGLKSNDTRRWQKNPHLKTSLEYLHTIFGYLEKQKITMYRMSSDVAPYVTHPDMPQFHGQVSESLSELDALGRRAREIGLRLSFHPSQYTILNSPDPELNRKSVLDIESQATILDHMGAGPEGVIIVHVGGVYGDKASAMDRWEASYKALPEASKRRLVLENDDISYSAGNVLELHSRTGCRACSTRTIFAATTWRVSTWARRRRSSSRRGQQACGRRYTFPRRARRCANSSAATARPRSWRPWRCRRSGPDTRTTPTRLRSST